MLEYLLAKARLDELLREAETERMLKKAKDIKVIEGSNIDKNEVQQRKDRSKARL
ncbi:MULTISPECIES: hypothetical protein [Pseudothermotoga]|jgi:hypothetical protein|uniref:hypothetical protein n=1 Tax=Pseudothermotoga TaxID=1643951 RepID=UPI0002D67565|nr:MULTISPECIES: hypothetical protein [Pseudothermotoga]KUK21625.1 MAG: hypothetical protein XD56_0479 [Pseudothermotoga lettingae]MDI3495247.1 hypothetical protein [Pseudothermotoga sp.]MDK2885139.1 hypothetical protein [Pseudothermotoga sp.]GLI48410.1 hypothetical protein PLETTINGATMO_05790 [Pseudothermotoga lettingae TMO]